MTRTETGPYASPHRDADAGRPDAMRLASASHDTPLLAVATRFARFAWVLLLAIGLGQAFAQSPAGTAPAPGEAARPPAPTGGASAAPGRPRIGLALSGGGARGFAHVGVLRVLEEMRIPVDCIAGTSAGSAVGAAYASGLSPDEIERALRSVDWDRDMFDDSPPRRDQQPRRRNEEKAYLLDLTVGYRDGSVLMPPGLISGQKIELFLHRMLGASARLESFDRLPIPFRAIATDLEIGEMVVQDRGSLVTAVRASMAVPSAFAPVRSGGRLLVDGGLTRNMPVDVVRRMCADVVIAVDIAGGLLTKDELGGVLAVASQMVGILMERNMRESREQVRPGQDVMIKPDLGDIGSASFSRGVDGIPAGAAAARAAAPELARLAVSEEAYASWASARRSAFVRDDRYAGVRVVGTDAVTASTLLAQSGLATRGTLDRPALERAVNAWNSSGDFDRIGYSLIPDGPGQVLQLDVVERGLGPNYLRFGLGAAADSTGNGVFNVMLGYRRPNFNSLGGEFRSELQFGTTQRFVSEVFQPVNRGSARFFLNPQLLFEEVPVWLFNDRKRIAEYGVRTAQLGLDLGVQGRYGEARLGVFGGTRTELPRTGSVIWPRINEGFWGAQFAASVDQLDATDFPRDGYLLGLNLRVEDVSPERGDAYMARRIQLVGKQVASWGDHTFAAAFRVGEANDRLGLNQLFSLGGFMNLSGLQINQVLGTSLRYASLSYQNQILTLPNPLGRGVYAGLAVESATMRGASLGVDTNGWLSGLTAFLGAHTGIGPVYLGYGYAQGGNRLIYLFLGRPGL
jgi:NTE family protein